MRGIHATCAAMLLLYSGLWTGCGGDDGDGGPPPSPALDVDNPSGPPPGDGDMPAQPGPASSTDDGDAPAPGPTTNDEPVPDPMAAETCDPWRLRCRGVCFAAAGQKAMGCEVLYHRASGERPVFRAFFGDGVAYVQVETSQSRAYDLLRLDLATGAVTTVIEGTNGFDDARVHDGKLYIIGYHEPWGDLGYYAVLEVGGDGALTPASGMLAQFARPGWNIFDGDLYIVYDTDDGENAIYRSALGASADAPFRPEEGDGGELIAAGVGANRMASDGTYLYFAPDYVGPLSRVRIGQPDSAEELNAEWSYNFARGFGLPAADPDHVYFAMIGLHRVPRAGGASEDLVDFPGSEQWVGDEELIAYSSTLNTLNAVRYVPPMVVPIDEDGEEVIDAFADERGYYVASKWGITRIARE